MRNHRFISSAYYKGFKDQSLNWPNLWGLLFLAMDLRVSQKALVHNQKGNSFLLYFFVFILVFTPIENLHASLNCQEIFAGQQQTASGLDLSRFELNITADGIITPKKGSVSFEAGLIEKLIDLNVVVRTTPREEVEESTSLIAKVVDHNALPLEIWIDPTFLQLAKTGNRTTSLLPVLRREAQHAVSVAKYHSAKTEKEAILASADLLTFGLVKESRDALRVNQVLNQVPDRYTHEPSFSNEIRVGLQESYRDISNELALKRFRELEALSNLQIYLLENSLKSPTWMLIEHYSKRQLHIFYFELPGGEVYFVGLRYPRLLDNDADTMAQILKQALANLKAQRSQVQKARMRWLFPNMN